MNRFPLLCDSPVIALPLLLLWLVSSGPLLAGESGYIHHDLSVEIEPAQHLLRVSDRITVDGGVSRDLRFTLHRDLVLLTHDEGVRIEPIESGREQHYRLLLPAGVNTFTLQYEGSIHHPLEAYGKEQARGFRDTPGLISSEGVYLSASSGWVPAFRGEKGVRFKLRVELPQGWRAVSQGERVKNGDHGGSAWKADTPQQEIYLIAAPFVEYRGRAGEIETLVFLRAEDQRLADSYLEATAHYLSLYEKLLGEYPYGKFALVENFWETGFGMPSFTLLGPKVIRLPFILHSSYPHEILHNWWGNGVYVDYPGGNWSEGLTAYLADHLVKEQRGQGVDYRQQALQKYSDYAAKKRDFPLREFRARHSSASEAVGYGKALMLFHMLRQKLGDGAFTDGLRRFYQGNKFRIASWADLQAAFEEVSGMDLAGFFSQWVERAGAPLLTAAEAKIEEMGEVYRLRFELRQMQAGSAYSLRVPVAVTLAGQEDAWQGEVVMTQKRQSFQLNLPARPDRLDIDPEYDLFRQLTTAETPPAFTESFGSNELLVLIPADADAGLQKAYLAFARSVQKMGPEKVTIRLDDEINSIPEGQAVMLLGWENHFRPEMAAALSGRRTEFEPDSVRLPDSVLTRSDHTFAIAARRESDAAAPLSFVATDSPAALPGLARKLPHYHKYSYLGFAGEEPEIRAKGRWEVLNSPLSIFPGNPVARGNLSKRTALAQPEQAYSKERMIETVRFLADGSFEGRGFGDPGLEQAADYIAGRFREAGLQPAGDRRGSYFSSWPARGGEPEREAELKNVVGVIPAVGGKADAESIVIGAHYDHLGHGWPDVRGDNRDRIHYGADDNASGVSVLIELARVLGRRLKPERNLLFVAFSGEEAGRLGSKHFVSQAQGKGRIAGMINLDTVGRLDGKPLLVLGAGSAREWPHIFRGIGYVTGIPIKIVAEELDASDHLSFREAGIPAVQLFSGPNDDYHRPTDTADKIDAAGLVQVAAVVKEAVEHLSSTGATLTPLSGKRIGGIEKAGKPRRVTLGTVPDFAYSGEGYRLSGVTPDSPADAVGLQEGDIIVELAGKPIAGLRDLSRALKTLDPGDPVRIKFKRQDQGMEADVLLDAK